MNELAKKKRRMKLNRLKEGSFNWKRKNVRKKKVEKKK